MYALVLPMISSGLLFFLQLTMDKQATFGTVFTIVFTGCSSLFPCILFGISILVLITSATISCIAFSLTCSFGHCVLQRKGFHFSFVLH
ncbi:hypothetical protein F5050DRAFT_1060868 [Lentinula boryana]|uniref:Uncharacterized protein n=1 Tax=Lentinula boryana TaxID=40481 RepID=A0ABQ8QKK6_9AGAR|nr:hypothetical protein F5050DRAFT_1060868 [Lentinula boryana]